MIARFTPAAKEILEGICLQLHLDTDSMKVNK